LETELKLQFPSYDEMLKLWNAEWFRDILIPESEKTERYDTRYFDTADRAILAFNASIRVREVKDSDYIHTVKVGGSSRNGLHQRFEWNLETERDEFDPDYFLNNAISDGDPAETLTDVLDVVRGKDLVMICSTAFSRTVSLAGFGDSLLEVSLDFGTLTAADSEEPICEMEIELKQGDVRDVLAFGEEILAQSEAVRNNSSKYGRCLALLRKNEQNG
jgi:triphosphatase